MKWPLLIIFVLFASVTLACEQKSNFMDRLNDNCALNDTICTDGETPLNNQDCEVTTQSIECKGNRCIWQEMWFAKLLLIIAAILIIAYKPDYDMFILATILLLITGFSGMVDFKIASNPGQGPVQFTKEEISSNMFLQVGSTVMPSNPIIGIIVALVILVFILGYLFDKSQFLLWPWRRKRK